MADDDDGFRNGKEIRRRIIRERRAFDGETKLLSFSYPGRPCDFRARPTLRQAPAVTGKNLLIRGGALGGDWQVELELGASRDADFFAHEPGRFGGELNCGILQRARRGDFLKQQNFIVVAVNLNIAGLVKV